MSFSANQRHAHGFSLVEIMTTIAIIGILVGVAIQSYRGINERTAAVTTQDFTESLNKAVRLFEQSNWDFAVAADHSVSTDEFIVLRALQYQWPASAMKPASPYFSPNYNPTASSDSTKHRIRWTGRTFESLLPGTAGTGFLKTFAGADYTTAAYVFPNGYTVPGP
jgi:prepilin-type N-terminal cleavage/methylation domain-containing protein